MSQPLCYSFGSILTSTDKYNTFSSLKDTCEANRIVIKSMVSMENKCFLIDGNRNALIHKDSVVLIMMNMNTAKKEKK